MTISSEPVPSAERATDDTNAIMGQLFIVSRAWPQEVIVEPSRLASSVWGDDEGDIYAAYCADTFPKIKTFVHEGHLYTNGCCSDGFASCYPLIPKDQYNGASQVLYSYEGESVKYKGQSFRLGPKIKFASRERTLQEETDLLRRKYAYGGYFAAGKTYREVLCAFERDEMSHGLKVAIHLELEREDLPKTQCEMLARLGNHSEDSKSDKDNLSQPTFPGFFL